MKSFVRWSATLGLVGSTIVGSLFTGNLAALALPEAQVLEKLQYVPVFTLTDAQGAPLVASVPNGDNKTASIARIFISQKDAQAVVERLKTEQPDLGKIAQVVPISLADVYKLGNQNQNKPDGLTFAFIPVQQQVQSAQAIIGQSGQQAQQFPGTPLFFATGGQQQGYITIERNGKSEIPLCFDKEQLQQLVDSFKQQKPELASTVKIQAVPLERVINLLKTSNDAVLNNIVIVPSKEAMDFVHSRPAAAPQQNAPQNQRR